MIVVLTIEDTTKGVAIGRRFSFSGVNDGTERSLAAHLMARFENDIAEVMCAKALVVESRENFPPTRR